MADAPADMEFNFDLATEQVDDDGVILPAVEKAAAKMSLSILDQVRNDLQKAEEEPTVKLSIPAMKGYEVLLNTVIPYERLQAWVKRGKDRGVNSGVNELRVSATIIASQCRGLFVNNEQILHEGQAVVFGSPEFMEAIDVQSAVEAVKKLYRYDGHVMQAAQRLLQESGYAEEVFDPSTLEN